MIKIGIDKTDMSFRHFFFNDSEVLTSNPPKYKIWYVDDEEDVSFIECSKVITLKNQDGSIIQKQDNTSNTSTQPNLVIEEVNTYETYIDENAKEIEHVEIEHKEEPIVITDTQPEKRKRGRPKGSFKVKTVETPQIVENNLFEYQVKDWELNDEFENKLNEKGKEGWELCGFEIYRPKILSGDNKVLCVFKRKIIET